MNKAEAAYAAHLSENTSVAGWFFDSISLRLADKTFYKPDFMVILATGEIEFHDVKGQWGKGDDAKAHWEGDARVKIKVASEKFPCFVWKGVSYNKRTGWVEEVF